MKLQPEQKIQIRGMAIDLAIRSGATDENLLEKSQQLYDFILKDQEDAQMKQELAAQNKVISLV